MAFKFTKENIVKAKTYLKAYPQGREQSAIKSLLDLAQRQNNGWLSKECLEYVADFLSMRYIKVLEIATFYNMFQLAPVGKYHIKLCRTTPCWLRGSDDIKKACEHHLDIRVNDMTDDGLFSISEVECLGACINGPIVQINDDYYEDLTPAALCTTLEKIAEEQHEKIKSPTSIDHIQEHTDA
jgi:NADH-quinone oxidoreductase E subunit